MVDFRILCAVSFPTKDGFSIRGKGKTPLLWGGQLPVNYREGLQAALYLALPKGLGKKLHDEGLVVEGRPMKL